jgi:hypothetical protein
VDVLLANEGFHVFGRAFEENDCTRLLHAPAKNNRKKRVLLWSRLFVCPSDLTEQCDTRKTDFREILLLKFVLNFVETFRLWPKSDKNKTLYFKTCLHFL